jgi:two-component system response regulator HydG
MEHVKQDGVPPVLSAPLLRAPCREPLQAPRLCGLCRTSPEVDGLRRCSRVVAESASMQRLLARAGVVAPTGAPILITGETGTGKEVVARLVHANSPRQGRPFAAVNVAALPPELIESELFGHVKGAFTGAVSTTSGVLGDAEGGTVLLDEIGEMPQRIQARLLRFLQGGEARRVGEARPRHLDVRVISATHRDLGALVGEQAFREDLYYRLNVVSLVVPPLRERPEDVLPLARMFAQRLGLASLELAPRARRWLERFTWPGNVRQLGSVIEHGIAFARGGAVDLEHFPTELTAERAAVPARSVLRPLADVEREHVRAVLAACGNNQAEAARILRIGRSTLWRKLAEGR